MTDLAWPVHCPCKSTLRGPESPPGPVGVCIQYTSQSACNTHKHLFYLSMYGTLARNLEARTTLPTVCTEIRSKSYVMPYQRKQMRHHAEVKGELVPQLVSKRARTFRLP